MWTVAPAFVKIVDLAYTGKLRDLRFVVAFCAAVHDSIKKESPQVMRTL
jgi:hypothetical protein